MFVHGNVSSSRSFEETLAALSGETKPVDATRDLADFSNDRVT